MRGSAGLERSPDAVARRIDPHDGRLKMERVSTQRGLQPSEWYVEARLVSRIAAYNGPLLECMRRWLCLPSVEGARAFILIEAGSCKVLKPTELSEIVSSPEFLSFN